MSRFIYFLLIIAFFYSCSDTSEIESNIHTIEEEFQWTVPEKSITGSFNPFELALNPTFKTSDEIDFIEDESLVAMISFNETVKVYPYQYISTFESINDQLDGKDFAITYCPQTKSTVCWDRNYKDNDMILRASGFLLRDNLVAYDSSSDTYWSQMGAECIKGKYAGEINKTYNVIETKWKHVKKYFPNALVFTNSSIANKSQNKTKKTTDEIAIGDSVFGIIDKVAISTKPEGKKEAVHGFTYSMFDQKTKIYSRTLTAEKVIIIGNSNLHYISAFTNDSNSEFTPIQNEYPVIMTDNNGNKWNIFGIAVSGPRKGERLESPTNYVALYWAWQAFYDTINI